MFKRCEAFQQLFEELQETNSRLTKNTCIEVFKKRYPDYVDDLQIIIETLTGKHKIGWTFTAYPNVTLNNPHLNTIRDAIETLKEQQYCSLAEDQIKVTECFIGSSLGQFLEPILNRTLKLGIGSSLIPVDPTSPMLAKTLFKTGNVYNDIYYITEKLDGNRAIAVNEDGKWLWYSRNGKVRTRDEFDMSGCDPDWIYDGEIIGKEGESFQSISGKLNSLGECGGRYMIFDIMNTDLPYVERRNILNLLKGSHNVQVIPVLDTTPNNFIEEKANYWLDKIRKQGGEGIMLNSGQGKYQGGKTRRDAILKYKEAYDADMKVVDMYEGKAGTKYQGQCGGIICELDTGEEFIRAEVGGGLSDDQRLCWWLDKTLIVGKIVQVRFNEVTQNAQTRGTNQFSLRFPRLIAVREDKTETNIY